MDTPRSLILITVDCLRADHVGFNGYARATTPFLDSLAAEGIVFDNAIVTGAPTYYSFPGIMASRYALAFGRDVVGLAAGEPTLATELRRTGYATGAFLAGNPYLSARFGYDAGFDMFRDFLNEELKSLSDGVGVNDVGLTEDRWLTRLNRALAGTCHSLGPFGKFYDELYFRYAQSKAPRVDSMDVLRRFPAADRIVDEACAWLAYVGENPFFLWLHLMDPHSPYYPPEDAIALMGDRPARPQEARYLNSYWNRGDLEVERLAKRRGQVNVLYDAGIRWMDKHLGRLVEALRETQRWQNCVFALTADHGEEFLEHGGRYHPPLKLTEELIRVPLLLCAPVSRKSRRVQAPFSLLHLAPTLLDAVGHAAPRQFQGRSYWQKLQKEDEEKDAALVECVAGCTNPFRASDRLGPRILAVREQRYKLVLDFRSKATLLFDLESDPAESKPLPQEAEKPVRRRLLESALLHVRRSQQAPDPESQLKARLKELQFEWELSNR